MTESNDLELVALLRNDAVQAFKELYDKYWLKLFSIAVQKLPSKEDAGDVVQDLFLQIWKKRNDLYITDSLDAYLFISIKNRILSFYKKKHAEERKRFTVINKTPLVSDADPEAILKVKELQGIVHDEIQSMPDKMRNVFELSRIGSLSSQAISNHLSISDQTVRNQISTALKRIKHRLQINT
jgi:RNA polymerase sigma-70 factor (ECF subfamily)